MLSIATLHAVDYYTDAASEAFGYYGGQQGSGEVDPPGHWTGALARQYFGTDASVRREDFAALFFGIDPQSGRSLTKSADPLGFACWQAERIAADPARSADERRAARQQAGELRGQIKARESKDGWRGHRAGIDLTFSAPKDFSLLVAAADPDERQRLLAAWRRSVEATLTDAEQRYAKTRLRDPAGRLTKEHIAGAAIAMFEHIAARPVGDQPPDPDAHLHCVMFSPVLCHDAATRALFSNDLRLNLKVLDAEARARLAQELAGMGYAVTEDRQKHCTSFHLPGISEAERIRYSKRRGEIVAGLAAGQFQSSAVAAIGTRQGKGDWSRADGPPAAVGHACRAPRAMDAIRRAVRTGSGFTDRQAPPAPATGRPERRSGTASVLIRRRDPPARPSHWHPRQEEENSHGNTGALPRHRASAARPDRGDGTRRLRRGAAAHPDHLEAGLRHAPFAGVYAGLSPSAR